MPTCGRGGLNVAFLHSSLPLVSYLGFFSSPSPTAQSDNSSQGPGSTGGEGKCLYKFLCAMCVFRACTNSDGVHVMHVQGSIIRTESSAKRRDSRKYSAANGSGSRRTPSNSSRSSNKNSRRNKCNSNSSSRSSSSSSTRCTNNTEKRGYLYFSLFNSVYPYLALFLSKLIVSLTLSCALLFFSLTPKTHLVSHVF